MNEFGKSLFRLCQYDDLTVKNVKTVEGYWGGEDTYHPPFAVLELVSPGASLVNEQCVSGEDREFIADLFGVDVSDLKTSVEEGRLKIFVDLPYLEEEDDEWVAFK